MSVDSRPLSVLIVAVRPAAAVELQTLLQSHHQTVITRVGSLDLGADDDLGIHDAEVILIGMDTTPVRDEPTLARWLRPSIGVPAVIVSALDDDGNLLAALALGATGYLLPATSAGELVNALQRVARGETVVDLGMGGRIASRVAAGQSLRRTTRDRWDLSPREHQILEALLEGRNNREIARHLSLGEETVKSHLGSLYRKLGVRDRAQAIAFSLRCRQSPGGPS